MSAVFPPSAIKGWARWDEWAASAALVLMVLIPVAELVLRPAMGQGVMNAPVLVQHLGLVMAMFGALAAERHGHLTTLGGPLSERASPARRTAQVLAWAITGVICGALAMASARFVESERTAAQILAYGLPVWWVQLTMPVGFALLGYRFARRCAIQPAKRLVWAAGLPAVGAAAAAWCDGLATPLLPAVFGLVALLWAGAPIFAALGGLALALFWSDALPLASVALSHYQITVNPSLPALPLFTLAGLVLARTDAARRLGNVFLALFGGGVNGTVLAAALLCSAFTALTGGSGVTILALGGLLLTMLRNAGYDEQRGIGLVTSASALGVLLAPSVPLIMYAVIARAPMRDMFLAGLLPALVMVACLLLIGGYWRPRFAAANNPLPAASREPVQAQHVWAAVWAAKWELAAPLTAVGSLVAGVATPTEAAALTAAYAVLTQAWVHRELGWRQLAKTLSDCTQLIGGVMLILGMALALTNFLVDAGIPDAAVGWVQSAIPNRYAFLLVLCLFLCAAAALMEIFAALVVLVPLLLPLAKAYGIDTVHFGIIFLAAMEVGFLCPPAGMNVYFASAMFNKPVGYVARSVLPALLAIFAGTLLIAAWPDLTLALPRLLAT